MARQILPSESFQDLSFPLAGVDVSQGFGRQPNRPTEAGYARTTAVGVNVRAYDPVTNRARGASRPGLARYINARVNGTNLIQELGCLTSTQGTSVQTSQSGRVVTLVAVSQGVVYSAPAGATAWTAANLGSGVSSAAFNTTGVVQSAANNQLLYMVDGTNARYYDPSTNTVYAWTATAGSFPVDSAGRKPRLICTWRGRTVLSGIQDDPQNIFWSAVSDPTDFDYSPASQSPTQAIAANLAPFGLLGLPVTSLIPFNDDVLCVGCDSEIHLMRGDPYAGGQVDRISDGIGMAWGMPWCKDPYGAAYFFSNRTGIFMLVPGQLPQCISQPIKNLLLSVNSGTHTVRMIWDDRFEGLHVFITKTSAAAATTHYFFEKRTGAWWQDEFGNNNHNPLCCVTFDGNLPDDRVALIGSWDGYVRYLDPDATKDDGTNIASEVILGPMTTKDLDELLAKEMQAVLGETSGDVTYAVYVGLTSEAALSADPVVTGTWSAGRNFSNMIRRAGHALYVKITATNPWAFENLRIRLAAQGKVRRRGR